MTQDRLPISTDTHTIGLSARDLGLIYFVALLMRLVYIGTISSPELHAFIEDSSHYWNGAVAWLESGFFSYRIGNTYVPETERMPLYHLFLIPFRGLFGDNVLPVMVAQGFVDAGSCVLIASLGAMARRRIGLAAGLFAAFAPNLIIHASLILGDSLFLFFISAVLLSAARYLKKPSLMDAACAGLFCGLAIATRSVALFLPLALAISAPLISYRTTGNWRKGGGAAIIILVIAAIPIAPILVRNVTTYDTFQLTSQGGRHFLNWVVGYTQSIEAGEAFETGAQSLNAKFKILAAKEGLAIDTPLQHTPFRYSRLASRLAMSELANIPLSNLANAWLTGSILNLASPSVVVEPRIRELNRGSFMGSKGSGLLKRSWYFLSNNDSRYVLWFILGFSGAAIFLLMQAAGWVLALRCYFWPAFFGTLAILYFLLTSGPVGSPKYRLPFEPVLMLFQSIAVLYLFDRFRAYRKRRSQSGGSP